MTRCNLCGSPRSRPLFTTRGYDLVSCADCTLAYIANPPCGETIARIYSDEERYHDALRDPQSSEWRVSAATAAQHMAFLTAAERRGRILDVGCSTGQFLTLCKAVGMDGEGIELNAGSARFASSHFGLRVHGAPVQECRFEAGSFDAISMFDVIEHLPDPAGELARIVPLLKPRGLLVLSTPNIDGLFPRLSRPLARPLDYWPHPEPPHHLFQFSVRTLSAMLRKAGFTPVRVAHRRIPLAYSFGTLRNLLRMPKRLAYAVLFAPASILGPVVGRGDWFYIAARKAA